MKVLLDANVVLDVFLERQPFCASAAKILGLSKGGIRLFVSASTITDIYYIIRKSTGNTMVVKMLENLLASVGVASVTGNEIHKALYLG